MHCGLEWAEVANTVGQQNNASDQKVIGDEHKGYYCVTNGGTSVLSGSQTKEDEFKWITVPCPFEPPQRINYVTFLTTIEQRPFVFVVGGKELALPSFDFAEGHVNEKDKVAPSKIFDEAKKK